MRPGEIYRDDAFYVDRATGEERRKYFIVLAVPDGDDAVARLLTSKATARPELPPCNHANPYPSFYLGVLGNPLGTKTWLDLRRLDDFDPLELANLERRGLIQRTQLTVPGDLLVDAIECAAGAPDTTTRQERHLRDTLADLRRQKGPPARQDR